MVLMTVSAKGRAWQQPSLLSSMTLLFEPDAS
jgi:hypothetical protein